MYRQAYSSKSLIKLCNDDSKLDKSTMILKNLDCNNIRKCDYPWVYKHLCKADFIKLLIDWNDNLEYQQIMHINTIRHSANTFLFLDYMFKYYLKNDIKCYYYILNNVWIMKTKFYSHICSKWNASYINFLNNL